MRLYSVHAPPDAPVEPERFRFVKDGISWPALFLPVIFILWHRLWLTLVYYVVFVLVVAWTDRLLGDDPAFLVAILGTILFALEANNIRRAKLEGEGWTEVGGAIGRNAGEAEARFFTGWAGDSETAERREAIARAAYSPEARAHGADEAILGLFPEPER